MKSGFQIATPKLFGTIKNNIKRIERKTLSFVFLRVNIISLLILTNLNNFFNYKGFDYVENESNKIKRYINAILTQTDSITDNYRRVVG